MTELEQVIEQIHKHKGALHIRPASQLIPFNHLSTGAFTLDFALMGGILEGLATMLYGWESSGKTTIADRLIASVQRKYPDQRAAFIDVENTFDVDWAKRHGVDVENLQLAQPESGEEAVDIVAALLDAKETSLIVIDSIPAMVPQKMIENSAEDVTVGALARLMGQMCSKILMSWSKERKRNHWVTIVFTNQFRSKIGVMFGDPRTLPGGNQLRYLVTTRVELKNKEVMGKDEHDLEVVEMNEHSFKVTKAKGGSSIRNGEFQMVVNPNHDLPMGTFLDAATVATYARKMGLITGAGSHWKIENVDQNFGKLADMETFMYENEPEFLRLKQKIIAQQRTIKGLPPLPPDGYLLDWNARENLDVEAAETQEAG